MTASKLEESIEDLAAVIKGPEFNKETLAKYLTAFAEAVWESIAKGQYRLCRCENPSDKNFDHFINSACMAKLGPQQIVGCPNCHRLMTDQPCSAPCHPEPKECECICHEGFVARRCQYCAANHKPPAALPDEVRKKMNLFIARNWGKHYPLPMDFSVGLEELLRLCLSLRKP